MAENMNISFVEKIISKLEGMGRRFLMDIIPRNGIGAEIGVHRGGFAAELIKNVQPRKFHLIDPWQHEPSDEYKNSWYGGAAKGKQEEMDARYKCVQQRFSQEIASGQVEINRGFSDVVSSQFAADYFDWVYIDGNHLYEFVKKDLESYFSKLKRGGLLIGDDYATKGWWNDGVTKAVDEFAKRPDVETIIIKNRQFVLKKI